MADQHFGGRADDAAVKKVTAPHRPLRIADGEVQMRTVGRERPRERHDLERPCNLVSGVPSREAQARDGQAPDRRRHVARGRPGCLERGLERRAKIIAGAQAQSVDGQGAYSSPL